MSENIRNCAYTKQNMSNSKFTSSRRDRFLNIFRKRKIDEELSQNVNIARNRQRIQRMHDSQKKLKKFKRADLVNESYHIQKLKQIIV